MKSKYAINIISKSILSYGIVKSDPWSDDIATRITPTADRRSFTRLALIATAINLSVTVIDNAGPFTAYDSTQGASK